MYKIAEYSKQILEAFSGSKVLVISAPTGSGKSLYVPKLLSETYPTLRIFNVQPTISATITLYQRQSKQSESIKVGFAAEGDINYDDNTQLIYCTTGHMRKVILNYENLEKKPADVIMLDEMHSKSADNTIVLDILVHFAKKGLDVPKIILSSATFDDVFHSEINRKFESIVPNGVPLISIDLKSFDINVVYESTDFKNANDERRFKRAAEVINSYNRTQGRGVHILAFVPGKREMSILKNELRCNNADILEYSGKMEKENYEKIFGETTEGNIRKIIIATNAAEAAITIKDVGIVVDTMTAKIASSTESGTLELSVQFISQDSANQRKGRTGRTMNGICHRICTEEFFYDRDSSMIPEILRVPLHNYILEFLKYGFNPEEIVEEMDSYKVSETEKLIKDLKLFDYDNRKITEAGNFVADFPLSVRNGALLYNVLFGELKSEDYISAFMAITIISLIDTYNETFFYYPHGPQKETSEEKEERIKKHREMYFEKYRKYSDLETNLSWLYDLDIGQALIGLVKDEGKLIYDGSTKLKVNERFVKTFCVSSFLNNRKVTDMIKRIVKITSQILKYVIKTHKNVKGFTENGIIIGKSQPEKAANLIRNYLKDVYHDRIMASVAAPNGIYFRLLSSRKIRQIKEISNEKNLNEVFFSLSLGDDDTIYSIDDRSSFCSFTTEMNNPKTPRVFLPFMVYAINIHHFIGKRTTKRSVGFFIPMLSSSEMEVEREKFRVSNEEYIKRKAETATYSDVAQRVEEVEYIGSESDSTDAFIELAFTKMFPRLSRK